MVNSAAADPTWWSIAPAFVPAVVSCEMGAGHRAQQQECSPTLRPLIVHWQDWYREQLACLIIIVWLSCPCCPVQESIVPTSNVPNSYCVAKTKVELGTGYSVRVLLGGYQQPGWTVFMWGYPRALWVPGCQDLAARIPASSARLGCFFFLSFIS